MGEAAWKIAVTAGSFEDKTLSLSLDSQGLERKDMPRLFKHHSIIGNLTDVESGDSNS